MLIYLRGLNLLMGFSIQMMVIVVLVEITCILHSMQKIVLVEIEGGKMFLNS